MSAGTIALTNNSDIIHGTGTSFTSELDAGDFVVAIAGGTSYTLPVKSVDSATKLTLVSKYPGPSQNGLAWNAVPRATQNLITAAVVAQATEALRGLNYDKQNWQQVFSAADNITVRLPDGSTFSGPSWNKLASMVSGPTWDVISAVTSTPGNGTYVTGGRLRSVFNIGSSNELTGGFRVGKTIGQSGQADLTLFVSENGAPDRLWSFKGDGTFGSPGEVIATGTARISGASYPKIAFFPSQANSNAIGAMNAFECYIDTFSTSVSDFYLYRRRGDGSGTGQITAAFPKTSGTLALQGTSGLEYKKNIEDADKMEALDRITSQRMVNFIYKDDEQERIRFGVIAEEAEIIAPQYIKHNAEPVEDILDKEGNKIGHTTRDRPSVDINPIVMDLMGSVQVLKAEIEGLKAEIAELKA